MFTFSKNCEFRAMFYNWTNTDSFYLTSFYGCVSIILSFFILITIVTNLKTFDSSFFQLYVYDSVLNIFLHFINYFSMRLTLIACKDCSLGAFYAGLSMSTVIPTYLFSRVLAEHSFLLNFMQAMRYHMAYVQYTVITMVSLNRLTVLFKISVWEQVIKRLIDVKFRSEI